jgi:two-component system, LytTR family, sensor kinase
MKRNSFWFWIFPTIFALVVMTGIRLVTDTPTGYKFWERPIVFNLIEFASAILIAYIFQLIIYIFLKRSSRKTGKLSFNKLLLEYLYIWLIGVVIVNPSLVVIHYFTNDPPGLDDFVIATVIFSLFLIIVYSVFRGKQILDAYVAEKLQTQQVKNMQIETELKFLKAQFHPHFLFNALNTIYFQIDETNETPRKTIEKLSELLRYQLYDVNHPVYIEQEFNFINTYIDFQKTRMKDSLQLDVAFDPQLRNQKIHPLLLFPLIENAFKYVGGEYWIKISARLEMNSLIFEVSNAIPHAIEQKIKKGGVGLDNLKKRLDILYPYKYDLSASKANDVYVAKLIIEL